MTLSKYAENNLNNKTLFILLLLTAIFVVVNIVFSESIKYWSLIDREWSSYSAFYAFKYIDDIARSYIGISGALLLSTFLAKSIQILTVLSLIHIYYLYPNIFNKYPGAFLGLAITSISVTSLFIPPHGDALTSYFSEGLWLSQNSLNYREFATQPSWTEGGPVTYFISLYSLIIAISYLLVGNVSTVLLIHHVCSMLAATISLNIAYKIFKKKFDNTISFIGVLTILLIPAFSTEIIELNADIYILCFFLLSFWYFVEGRMLPSFVWSIALVLIKPVALIWVTTIAIITLLKMAADKRISAIRLTMLIPVALQLLIIYITSRVMALDTPALDITTHYIRVLRSISGIFITTGFISVFIWLVTFVIIAKGIKHAMPSIRNWRSIVLSEHINIPLTINLTVIAWILLFTLAVKYGSVPRYVVVIWPFLIFNIIYFFNKWRSGKHLYKVLGLVMASAVSSIGFHGPKAAVVSPYYVYLEKDIANYLSREYPGYLILTGRPLVQVLSVPEFGYVKDSINTITMSGTRVASIASTLMEDEIQVWPDNVLILYANGIYLPEKYKYTEEDDIIEKFSLYDSEIILYKRDMGAMSSENLDKI